MGWMMETRQRGVTLWQRGAKVKDIYNRLKEDIVVSQTSLYLLIGKLEKSKRASRPSILKHEHYEFIDRAMVENDELTDHRLYCVLKESYPGLDLSLSTVC